MKYFFCLLLISFHSLGSTVDSTAGSWSLQLRADYGFIIAHRPALEALQEEHVKGFEITVARHTSGEKYWESVFLCPDYGITLAAFDLGSPSQLGHGIALYPFVDFPLGIKCMKGLHFKYGMGLGYVEKTFDPHDNIKNDIGSHLNGVIHFDLHYEKKLSELSTLEIGTGITHYSNGSFSLPNLGINIATVNLAFHQSFGKSESLRHQRMCIYNHERQIHIYAGGFLKKVYPPEGRTYFASTISILRFKPINFKSAWGIGADIFYDNSITARIESTEGNKAKSFDNFRPGIYAAYHLSVNKIGVMFNMGYYLYNAWKDDGNIYHRICLRYYFDKSFICLNLKTHYARADFIELGFGWKFVKPRWNKETNQKIDEELQKSE